MTAPETLYLLLELVRLTFFDLVEPQATHLVRELWIRLVSLAQLDVLSLGLLIILDKFDSKSGFDVVLDGLDLLGSVL